MEIFLLVVVIGLLAYLVSNINSKFVQMDFKLRDLHRSLENLKKAEVIEKAVEKTVEKPITRPEPPLRATIPEPRVAPAIVKEEPKATLISENEKIPQPEMAAYPDATSKPTYVKPPPAPYVPQKSWWESFKDKNPDLEKFIGENLINKIGVLILVLGISYFVKFAIDKDWINEPARAGIGILSGALVMGFAHKLRKNYGAFSSVLVAGAISIFYFTIGIAFHDYHLFNQTVAFVIMVVITGFSCLISLSYDRKELAVLSLIGGFAVPFMVATGEGNYVVLFTYIAILDVGILAMAYYKKWSIINILSYIFTVLLYGGWLIGDNGGEHPHALGALVFGFVFYFIFILINIVNNLRTKGTFTAIELTILVSNTFLFYAAGMIVLEDYHPEYKGLFTTVLALLNLFYAWFLYKKFGLDKTAVYLLIGLTLTFATLAIPIQFEGNYITLFWAAEAVLLMWLAQKSGIVAYRFGSVVVNVLMMGSLVIDWVQIYESDQVLNIASNPIFITGVFVILTLLAVGRLLTKEDGTFTQFALVFDSVKYRGYLAALAISVSYVVGILEVGYQSFDYISSDHSAMALPIFYHLLFCAVLCRFMWKKSQLHAFASVLVIANILLYSFLFSMAPYGEHQNFLTTGLTSRIAFFLHYFSLATVLYMAYALYRQNKESAVFDLFRKDIVVWIAAFFVVYLASSELLLHSLYFSNSPVTKADFDTVALRNAINNNALEYFNQQMAIEKIANVRTQVIKTGFPILWGLLAFVFLIVGIKRQSKPIRIIALTLLGLTILKLFLFDIRNASETGKIVAFILLGVLILIISFVYNKIKVLVLDDTKPNPDA